MIVEYIRYRIDALQASAFVAAYEIASKSLKDSPHCLGYELSQCSEARDSYTLRILWDSEQGHMQGFRKSEQFPPFFAAVQPFLKSIEEMRHYEPTPLRWTRP
jgi:quinol monooxygenase YgiN